ncbi:MAG TPA: ATP-dependent helicase C-terminal domain-containing protein, partial [Gemmatimonadaceae bacterium]|nr:ATP-dependent helicase C-terminal domain-containing protein [Gemmatimonadaceae bacterium]
ELARALAAGLARSGAGALRWTDRARRLRERLAFLRTLEGDAWPDTSDPALARALAGWLATRAPPVRRREELQHLDASELLLSLLDWRQSAALDALAPTHVQVPSGSRVAVDYGDPHAPVLAVRLQEMFGARDTPRIAGGRVPLTLHLLSPAQRPVQVTRDLAGFWRSSYFDVRKDLRGRYPKHHWPDDPLQAEPTRRTRKPP